MFEFHKDKETYFNLTTKVTVEHVIPFISKVIDLKNRKLNVLEIGSGEAGVLKAFVDLGHNCTGIELSPGRVKVAEKLMKEAVDAGKIRFIAKDIYDIDPESLDSKFDLIILKDVIEHIHDQERVLIRLKEFLAPRGKIFFGFPPWYMPFGGHQQICKNKLAAVMPYYHILPKWLYKGILRLLGETERTCSDLIEIKDTGISIERFERLVDKTGYVQVLKKWYLFNPVYKYKFGIKPFRQLAIFSLLPFFRNFVTTCVYSIITPR